MSMDMGETERERRAAAREPIRRPVVFAGVRGEGLLRQGMAADISASGLLIHTTQPDLVGRHLELEIHPDGAPAPGDVIMVRGEVAWVSPLSGKGEYAMGVRFLQSMPATDATGATYRPAGREEAEALAQSIQRSLQAMEPAARLEISDTARLKTAPAQPAKIAGEKERRRWPRLLLLLLLLLLLGTLTVLLALAVMGTLDRRAPRPGPAGAAPQSTPAVAEPPAVATSAVSDIIEERLERIREEGPAYYVSRGSFLLARENFPAAAQAFQSAQRQPEVTPIERFIAELGEAEALARSDDLDAALAILERPFGDLDLIPEPWRALKEHFRDALLGRPATAEGRSPMVNAFAIDPVGRPAENSEDGPGGGGSGRDPNGPRIEIDTTRYLLTVLENNAIKAVYPVGLGARNFTPEGLYAIVNKIENPDWYNNGNVVPAGDPENQLGSRWLGLGDSGGPTPIGIHATGDLDSIGGNQSRGCIRMRPKDVEALFEYVPVGTPVHIRAL